MLVSPYTMQYPQLFIQYPQLASYLPLSNPVYNVLVKEPPIQKIMKNIMTSMYDPYSLYKPDPLYRYPIKPIGYYPYTVRVLPQHKTVIRTGTPNPFITQILLDTKGGTCGVNQICFYNKDEPYYEFSNFYPVNVHINWSDYKSSEHYYQLQKFVRAPKPSIPDANIDSVRKSILAANTARQAYDIAHANEDKVDFNEWDKYKNEQMMIALCAKFSQNPGLRNLLVSTGYKKLVEHTSTDKYWGDGGDGSGQNMLGKMLMVVRDTLRVRDSCPIPVPTITSLIGGSPYYESYMKYKYKYEALKQSKRNSQKL